MSVSLDWVRLACGVLFILDVFALPFFRFGEAESSVRVVLLLKFRALPVLPREEKVPSSSSSSNTVGFGEGSQPDGLQASLSSVDGHRTGQEDSSRSKDEHASGEGKD